MEIAERGRREQGAEDVVREERGMHTGVRIMALTAAALTLPDANSLQMSSELERCQALERGGQF